MFELAKLSQVDDRDSRVHRSPIAKIYGRRVVRDFSKPVTEQVAESVVRVGQPSGSGGGVEEEKGSNARQYGQLTRPKRRFEVFHTQTQTLRKQTFLLSYLDLTQVLHTRCKIM